MNTIYYADGASAEAHMEEYWQHTPNRVLLDELNLPVRIDTAYSSLIIGGEIISNQGKQGKKYIETIFTKDEEQAWKSWNDKTWAIYHQLHSTLDHGKSIPPNLKDFMNISFAEYVSRAKLPKKVNEWIRITLEPEISVAWDSISALDGIDEFRIFLESPEGYGELNYHVAGGNIGYINALADQLPKGSIQIGKKVTKVQQTKDGVVISYVDQETGKTGIFTGLYAIALCQIIVYWTVAYSWLMAKCYL